MSGGWWRVPKGKIRPRTSDYVSTHLPLHLSARLFHILIWWFLELLQSTPNALMLTDCSIHMRLGAISVSYIDGDNSILILLAFLSVSCMYMARVFLILWAAYCSIAWSSLLLVLIHLENENINHTDLEFKRHLSWPMAFPRILADGLADQSRSCTVPMMKLGGERLVRNLIRLNLWKENWLIVKALRRHFEAPR